MAKFVDGRWSSKTLTSLPDREGNNDLLHRARAEVASLLFYKLQVQAGKSRPIDYRDVHRSLAAMVFNSELETRAYYPTRLCGYVCKYLI